MNRKEKIIRTEGFVRRKVAGFDSGRDWWHVESVRSMIPIAIMTVKLRANTVTSVVK